MAVVCQPPRETNRPSTLWTETRNKVTNPLYTTVPCVHTVDTPKRTYEVRASHEGAWERDFLFLVTECFTCAVQTVNGLAQKELDVYLEVFGTENNETLSFADFTHNFYIKPQEQGE